MGLFASNIITSDSALGSASIQRSLRFNRSDNAKLSKTFSSDGNRKKWTFSVWAKFPDINDSNTNQIFSYQQGHVNHRGSFYKGSSGVLNYQLRVGGTRKAFVTTDAKLRDPNSWYHIVLVIDSDQGSSTNRVKIYINGVQQSVVYHDTPASGFTTWINSTQTIYLGAAADENGGNMYLAECNFIDGSVLTPSSFGFTDPVTGIWMPKRYEGTYGTNGFYLDFSDNSSTAALGIDKSPNGNDWTTTNFSVSAGEGNDSLEDTPSNNFCTLNSLFMNGSETVACSNGNLDFTADNNYQEVLGTMSVKTGKWYWEVKPTSNPTNAAPQNFGITRGTGKGENSYVGYDNNGNGYGYSYDQAGNVVGGGSGDGVVNGATLATGQTSFTQNDIIGVAVDIPNGYLIFYKNGAHLYTISGINSHDWLPAFSAYASGTFSVNFGQRPFSYTPPLGHKELCARNILPDSSIVKPQKHFDTLLYTGDGAASGHRITGLQFQPDFVWIKNRGQTYDHHLYDSVRGVGKYLESNDTTAEATGSHQESFDSNGFTVGAGNVSNRTNYNGNTYVGWCWKAGGAAVSNSDGTITSQVSANTEAGFSIVSFTGNQTSGATVGHGLNSKPKWILVKERGNANDWTVYHESLGYTGGGDTYVLFLNLNNDYGGGFAGGFNNTAPTTSVFSLGNSVETNRSGGSFIAYCWSEVPGYSKFGSYAGNGASNGSYVHLGFRPAWVMFKRYDSSGNWFIVDNKRDTFNECTRDLYPNTNGAETDNPNFVDFLSNGFKLRTTGASVNSGKIVYMAFAEQPNPTPFDTSPNAR